jgi:hypothetical protein
LNGDTELFQIAHKLFVELLRLLGRSGFYKGRTPSLTAISVKSELGYHQSASPHIHKRAIHLPLIIRKDPEMSDLFCKPTAILRGIPRGNPQEHAKTLIHRPLKSFFYRYFSISYPLYHCPHLITPEKLAESPEER